MNVKIYQIYYLDEQKSKLDSDFIPYDNTALTGSDLASRKLREWTVLLGDGQKRAKEDNADIWGFTSHKFAEKTNATGKDFIKFIHDNPGYDVWFMEPQYVNNPFINVWDQGESCHPGIIQLINTVFKYSNIDIDVCPIPMPFCYFNFFAGNQKFWDILLGAVNEIIETSKHLPQLDKMLFYEEAGHKSDSTIPYFPFVAERMASTVMALGDIKSVGMPFYHSDFIFFKRN
jgi:hypothetical protein